MDLHRLTLTVYSFIIGVEVPGPGNTKKLLHMIAGTPDSKHYWFNLMGSCITLHWLQPAIWTVTQPLLSE